MSVWGRRKNRDETFDPLASKEDAETFGTAYGVGAAIGVNPVVAGAAALYAKAEAEERARQERARTPHAAGSPPAGAKRAGEE